MKKGCLLLMMLVGAFVTNLNAQVTEASLVRDDGSLLHYYLSGESSNLLILLQGSSCNSVLYNRAINEMFSSILDDKSVLTVEKYGITKSLNWDDNPEREDCPTATIEMDSPTQRALDIKQILTYLLSKKPYNNVVVLGGSEGALVANMLSATFSGIKATITLNGGGRWFVDDVLYNIQQTTPTEQIEKEKQQFLGFKQFILSDANVAINPNPQIENRFEVKSF